MDTETNPDYAIRMHDAFNAGKLAGWSHANRALEAGSTESESESAYEASERLSADRMEDERAKFVSGFYGGVDDRLGLTRPPIRLLRF